MIWGSGITTNAETGRKSRPEQHPDSPIPRESASSPSARWLVDLRQETIKVITVPAVGYLIQWGNLNNMFNFELDSVNGLQMIIFNHTVFMLSHCKVSGKRIVFVNFSNLSYRLIYSFGVLPEPKEWFLGTIMNVCTDLQRPREPNQWADFDQIYYCI